MDEYLLNILFIFFLLKSNKGKNFSGPISYFSKDIFLNYKSLFLRNFNGIYS